MFTEAKVAKQFYSILQLFVFILNYYQLFFYLCKGYRINT